MQPLGDTLIVRDEEEAKQSGGGLILAGISRPLLTAVVEAAGEFSDPLLTKPSQVKTGDRVLYSKGLGIPLKINGVQYNQLQHKSLLCIIEADEKYTL